MSDSDEEKVGINYLQWQIRKFKSYGPKLEKLTQEFKDHLMELDIANNSVGSFDKKTVSDRMVKEYVKELTEAQDKLNRTIQKLQVFAANFMVANDNIATTRDKLQSSNVRVVTNVK